ncbi:hypothetical protein AB0B25_04415 [Nocardia sp. NPDC049190]|uniref:DUF6907 domain-containing protein n=1 Tax=Nocardia sp. NPDC049190 TaxID=3155650 RepID=UPI00340B2510
MIDGDRADGYVSVKFEDIGLPVVVDPLDLAAPDDGVDRDDKNNQWIDLHCASCGAIVGTIPAPAPTVPIRCQQCRRAPGCASWCPEGDGHGRELFDADRTCYGREQVVPMTIEPSPGLGMIANIEVSPLRRFGGRDSVYLLANQRHGSSDMDLTATEARQVAALLLEVAEQVENEQGGDRR